MKFSIGADPEIFVGDVSGAVRSIIGRIGGTKEHPRPLPLGDGFAVQEDNVALEFNIPASPSKESFINNICSATEFLEQLMIDQHGLMFNKASAVSFPDEELNDPAALVFGCDPDFNAWTRKRNPRPKAGDKNLRSCGGHVHIGCLDVDPVVGTKACDLFLAVPSVFMDQGFLRKNLYGKAGAFRKKPYGWEYRTLSNYWVFEQKLIGWVYDNTERALEAAKAGVDFDADKDLILQAVNENNREAAALLCGKYNLEVLG